MQTQQLEDELFDAALEETISNPVPAAAALAQIDAYFAKVNGGGEEQHRQSLLRLLGLSAAQPGRAIRRAVIAWVGKMAVNNRLIAAA